MFLNKAPIKVKRRYSESIIDQSYMNGCRNLLETMRTSINISEAHLREKFD